MIAALQARSVRWPGPGSIIEAEPAGAEQAAEAAAKERFVRLGRSSQHGLRLIIARATAGDAIWFKATIDRIAEILAQEGDTDPVELRRSKAIGILAQPVEAVRLLYQHQDDNCDGPDEPDDLADEPSEDDSDGDQTAPSEDGDPTAEVDHTPDSASSQEATHRSLKITPPPFNPDKARPRAIIYVHLSVEALTAGTGIARIEQVAPLLLSRLHMLLGDRCTIQLKPVIDLPAGHLPLDAYEIPASLREQLLLRNPADIFPYAAAVSRKIDIDHTIPYLSPDQGGPPGQTRIGNLGPHVHHHHHRMKTFSGWQVRQPQPGTSVWRSPHHRTYLVNATGTHPLGNSDFADTIWRAAENPVPALTN